MDIILIGIMGCGKTTLGKKIAQRLNIGFVDTDKEIEESERRTISNIFETDGEEYFRVKESGILRQLIGENRVIATGGGIVTREENHKIIKDSGAVVVFIDRPIENIIGNINTKSRPLLKDGKDKLVKIHKERYEKYLSLCDIRVVNDTDKEAIIDKILDEVKNYENNGDKRA